MADPIYYDHPMHPGYVDPAAEAEDKAQLADALELLDHAPGMYDAWTGMAFAKPPKDIIGRLLWSAGVTVQMFLSAMTFPAALGAFLLEEAVQTYGMGAYMLSTAKAYETLDIYIDNWKLFIDSAYEGAKNLATVNPVTGGAVVLYMLAARKSALAFESANVYNMFREAERDEALRKKLLDDATYATLRLSSTPSLAEIWINNVNTELLTPETFKQMDEGAYDLTLRKYNAAREEWDIFSFTINLEAGRKKEIHVRIPPTITSEEEEEVKPPMAQLTLKSSPSEAEIIMNGIKTDLLTPEAFRELTPGRYTFSLRAYHRRQDVWTEYSFTVTLEADKTTEIKAIIPIPEKEEEPITPPTTLGKLVLSSIPSDAEIWIDDINTNTATPETFDDMEAGTYMIKLRRFSRRFKEWDEYSFPVEITAGMKLELRINIPGAEYEAITPPDEVTEDDAPQLPLWIKAQVTGEYAIDGDTFITTTGERIRVLAIDAPEIGRPWADVSKEALGLLIEDKNISLRIQSHKPLGPHGRTLAICSSYKGDIAVFQLSSGLARVAEFEDDLFDYRKYYSAEQVAKDRKIGIWS